MGGGGGSDMSTSRGGQAGEQWRVKQVGVWCGIGHAVLVWGFLGLCCFFLAASAWTYSTNLG